MSVQIDWDFSGEEDAKAELGAAVKYLLRDARGAVRDDIVREIIETVHDIAGGLSPLQQQKPAMSRVTYKAYVIDAFQHDTDNWRATIRRLDGKKIRVAFPPAVLDEATTSADALTAGKAVEFAKRSIDGGAVT
ncbi:MAG TPA: hypothetical protein VK804_16045 [Bradyrhizobium sp.]|jgi:hypothetical protein|uniref:hypothetical protein n=1 Tax=Bradyrhizobium sp. TaxID=376 RepID=UPI002CFDD4A0|nr:hypothetical protein [Bradyrhizobium sp.]HTB01980.1 hypothetical protein [Bradyrhizobium sp.]